MMKMENVEFPEALAMLAERAGIQLEAVARRAEIGRRHRRKAIAVSGDGVGRRAVSSLSAKGRRRQSRRGSIWRNEKSRPKASNRFRFGFRAESLGLADQAVVEQRHFGKSVGNRGADCAHAGWPGALRSLSRPRAVSDSRCARPAGGIWWANICRSSPTRESGEVHQLAGDAAVLQKQHVVRIGFGTRCNGP